MINIIYIFVLLLVSCAPRQNQTIYPPQSAVKAPCTQAVNIVSHPAGVLIEVNDDIRGKTPLTLTFECYQDPLVAVLSRQPISNDPGHHIIRALPTVAGHCVQTKLLFTKNLPKNIYFPMDLCPANNKIELNVR